jgi:hypothetical protein
VEAVGADADLGAVAEFEAVGESRAGVPIDGGAVDGREEAAGGGFVGGDDGVAVIGAVAVDRCDGGVERIDDADGDDGVEKFGGVVGGRRGRDGRS